MNVTENDMNSATKVISDLWSAAVEGSKLAEEFKSFREHIANETKEFLRAIDEMKKDMEYVRERNARLDSENADLRRSRDEALSALSATRSDLNATTDALTKAGARIDSQVEILKSMDEKVDRLTKERDESIQEVLELEQKNKELSDRLEAVRTAMGFLSTPEAKPHTVSVAGTGTSSETVTPSDSGAGGGQVGQSEPEHTPSFPVY